MDERSCTRCGCTAYGSDEIKVAFRRNGVASALATRRRYRPVCRLCEITARTNEKLVDRWKVKARSSLNRHADKSIKSGVVRSRDEFASRFGWDVERMARDAEHAFAHECSYCHSAYSEMAHGPADVTFDISDPDEDPIYETNVTICCVTCNREKAKTPRRLWGAWLQFARRWRERQRTLEGHGGYGPETLFGDWGQR